MGLLIHRTNNRLMDEANPAGDAGGAEGAGEVIYKYPEGLDASYHNNATLMKYADKEGNFNNADIFKSLIHATSNIGKDKMTIPNEHFTPEQWAETNQLLGLPKEISEYGIENKQISEGIQADEKMFDGFKEVAFKAGIRQDQAQAIIDFFNTSVGETIEGQRTESQNSKQADLLSMKELWGNDFDRNDKLANEALSRFVETPEELAALKESGFLDKPNMKKLFAKVGQGLLEDTFSENLKGNLGQSNDQLEAERSAMYLDPAFTDKFHPQYRAKQKRFMEINTALAPGSMSEY